jgi:hypothetical protein
MIKDTGMTLPELVTWELELRTQMTQAREAGDVAKEQEIRHLIQWMVEISKDGPDRGPESYLAGTSDAFRNVVSNLRLKDQH